MKRLIRSRLPLIIKQTYFFSPIGETVILKTRFSDDTFPILQELVLQSQGEHSKVTEFWVVLLLFAGGCTHIKGLDTTSEKHPFLWLLITADRNPHKWRVILSSDLDQFSGGRLASF
jgi:hypothetical protein